MQSNWEIATIGSIVDEISMGPFGSDIKTDNFVDSGVPVIRGGNLTQGRFNPTGFVFLTPQKAASLGKANAYPGDIVITHRGTLGQVGLIPSGLYDRYVISQSQLKLKLNQKVADPIFVYYFLRSPIGQHRLLANTSQTGVPAISRPVTSVKAIKIPLPPLAEQRRIADILGTLDDKIELNQRMNATLEAMARALFKSWFVDFDPVHAKAAGRPTGLPAHIEALFPDSFVDSALGPIPEGWAVGRIEELLVLQRGFDLPTPDRTNGLYQVVSASGISGNHSEFMVKGPGVTTGRSGVLGKVYYIPNDFWPLNTSLYVKSFPKSTPLYAFHLLQTLDFKQLNTGSAVPSLNRNHIHDLLTVSPPVSFIHVYDKYAMSFIDTCESIKHNTVSLKSIRDTLLPKLLSGELAV
jgi:type I restriction enzyme S subunit